MPRSDLDELLDQVRKIAGDLPYGPEQSAAAALRREALAVAERADRTGDGMPARQLLERLTAYASTL